MWKVNGAGHNPVGPLGGCSARCLVPGPEALTPRTKGLQRKLWLPGPQGAVGMGWGFGLLYESCMPVPPKRWLARGAKGSGNHSPPCPPSGAQPPAQGEKFGTRERMRINPPRSDGRSLFAQPAAPPPPTPQPWRVGNPCRPQGGSAQRSCFLILHGDLPHRRQTSTPFIMPPLPPPRRLPCER